MGWLIISAFCVAIAAPLLVAIFIEGSHHDQ